MTFGLAIHDGVVGMGLHTTVSANVGDEVLRVEFDPSSRYVLPFPTKLTLQVGKDAHLYDPIIKHLNHHCDPSIRLDVAGNTVIGYALRALNPGDELTFNYMTLDERQADGGLPCQCGAPQCYGMLNGWDGLTRRQQEDLLPLVGGYIKERIMSEKQQKLLSELHGIMGDGTMEMCGMYIPTGACHCCQFGGGNWIGLLPGEVQYLKDGPTEDWTVIKDNGHGPQGIICHRDPSTCTTHKPLDCKLYPFFPISVEKWVDGTALVHLAAGDLKCAAKSVLVSALKGVVVEEGTTLPFGDHLVAAAKVGLQLHDNGLAYWMEETFSSYVGYSRGYTVLLKGDQS